ncbi:MAG: UDP-glucose/GDP-mannose dehydrogenase family protein [Acidobacteriota bacterium]
MKIGIIGTGYVGLVSAAGFAELGHNVVGTDVMPEKIEMAAKGIPHIYEPGLEDLLKNNLKRGNLTFSHDLEKTIRDADILFVCVNTPQREDGSADMSYVESVSRTIAQNLNKYKVIVEKSTVPVRTSAWIKRTISLYKKGSGDFDVASNPEFLREGSAVYDFLNPDRIVIGVETARARDMLVGIYEKFRDLVLITNIDTAELIKHASNSFLATKISFINLMADICEKTEADVELVAKGMGLDTRIGDQFLRAGLGYGGSCFPKDVRALIRIGEDFGLDFGLLKQVDRINDDRVRVFIEKVNKALWMVKNKKIAVLGLAFKPETDDLRNAPSIPVIRELLNEGANLFLYDPKAADHMKTIFPEAHEQITYVDSLYEAVTDANAALIITEWDDVKNVDLKKVKELMANPILIDGRNCFDPDDVRALGFEYYCMGRK